MLKLLNQLKKAKRVKLTAKKALKRLLKKNKSRPSLHPSKLLLKKEARMEKKRLLRRLTRPLNQRRKKLKRSPLDADT